jgi:hypothetical protein
MKRQSRLRYWLVAVAALAAVVALTSIASAHRKYYKSQVTIVLTPAAQDDLASGVVSAHRPACEAGRTVVLFTENKPGVTGQFIEIGRTTTDAAGNWTVPIQNGIKKGRAYHAQAKEKRVRNGGGHKHICKSKYSPDVAGS